MHAKFSVGYTAGHAEGLQRLVNVYFFKLWVKHIQLTSVNWTCNSYFRKNSKIAFTVRFKIIIIEWLQISRQTADGCRQWGMLRLLHPPVPTPLRMWPECDPDKVRAANKIIYISKRVFAHAQNHDIYVELQRLNLFISTPIGRPRDMWVYWTAINQ